MTRSKFNVKKVISFETKVSKFDGKIQVLITNVKTDFIKLQI